MSAASGSGSAGSAAFQAHGCAAPPADGIGTAFGAAITATVPTSDNGCWWQAGGPSEGVQVSYHTPADFNAVRVAALKANSTPVNVPGATDTFVKRIVLPNGTNNDIVYVVFSDGTVQIAFSGPSGFLTDQNESGVTKLIVG